MNELNEQELSTEEKNTLRARTYHTYNLSQHTYKKIKQQKKNTHKNFIHPGLNKIHSFSI